MTRRVFGPPAKIVCAKCGKDLSRTLDEEFWQHDCRSQPERHGPLVVKRPLRKRRHG
jgi:hypothetical protein